LNPEGKEKDKLGLDQTSTNYSKYLRLFPAIGGLLMFSCSYGSIRHQNIEPRIFVLQEPIRKSQDGGEIG
jgi:hypothetical protein